MPAEFRHPGQADRTRNHHIEIIASRTGSIDRDYAAGGTRTDRRDKKREAGNDRYGSLDAARSVEGIVQELSHGGSRSVYAEEDAIT